MEKLRRTVHIGPYMYRFRRSLEVDGGNHWADTSDLRKLISFAVLCNPKEMPGSLIHELIHAVGHVYGIKLEEGEIIALGNGLTQALQDLQLLPKEMDL